MKIGLTILTGGLLSGLMTNAPLSIFAQNNGVVRLYTFLSRIDIEASSRRSPSLVAQTGKLGGGVALCKEPSETLGLFSLTVFRLSLILYGILGKISGVFLSSQLRSPSSSSVSC